MYIQHIKYDNVSKLFAIALMLRLILCSFLLLKLFFIYFIEQRGNRKTSFFSWFVIFINKFVVSAR